MANPCVLRSDVVRARLASLEMTQASLAERSGVDLRTIQRWFAGGRASREDAERTAASLGLGTAEVFEGVPETTESPFARLRSVLAMIRLREGALGSALTAIVENFGFIDSMVRFSEHPTHGYVHREPMTASDRNAFVALRLTPRDLGTRGRTHVEFGGQVGRKFRYVFGEIALDEGRALLTESFHTRSSVAPRYDDGSIDVYVWVGTDMLELVLVSSADIRVRRLDHAPPTSIFDLGDSATAHAVCFRPSAMHLRDAGLASVFDRVRGSRDGRIDVPID